MNIVAHNILAANANRQLGIVSAAKKKTTEKLSSGYRINRSADDAAGLAISEKMRWQIRGLDKGSQNIGDGISLIQTAEGALNEVHSILQRVRELSVQALNDTNTESDRNKIQLEVEKSLEEIDHIRDTTMFNTKPLLQGNEYKDVKITPDTVTEYTVTMPMKRSVPSWVDWDNKVEVHSTYDYPQNTTDGIMKITNSPAERDSEGLFSGVYYGKKIDTEDGTGTIIEDGTRFVYGGEWSNNIKDNPSARISFDKLGINSPTVNDLKKNLIDLIGVKLEFPCGTCNDVVNSIGFTGSAEGISCYGFQKYNSDYRKDYSSTIDLSSTKITYDLGNGSKQYNGYFELIDDLKEKYVNNYDDDDTNDDPLGEEVESALIGLVISRDLRTKTYNALKSTVEQSDHFDRVFEASDGETHGIIVYDYRDANKLNDYHANLGVERSNAYITVPATSFQEGIIIPVEQKLNIMCGALNSSYIGLDLPDMSLDYLGLNGCSVDHYTTETSISYNMTNEQKQEYMDQLNAWKASARTEPRTGQRTIKTLVDYTPPVYDNYVTYDNGEKKHHSNLVSPAVTNYKEEIENYSYNVTVHDGPMPMPPKATEVISTRRTYTPSSLWLVDEAIDKVSRARAMLGSQQNRLEYTYNINNNTSENTSAAESRIRDTNMAKEMVNHSKHNILEQAGSSVLAQANQAQQGIISLVSA